MSFQKNIRTSSFTLALAALPASLGLATLTVTRVATAADDVPMTTYTVVAGDDCPVVAQKVFGDRARTDLVHKYNPQLGAPPHHLAPGQVLNVPAPTPDARLLFARNKVEVEAGSTRPGKQDDPLYHGNRVSTGAASSAGIDFHDESQLFLAEDTLLVIYGDAGKSKNTIQTTLLTGNLRAHLGALAGRELATPSGNVAIGTGDVQIAVDASKATRLAVYKGSSSMTASKKKIDVAAGYGSKAIVNTPPTPPRLLPGAPAWNDAPASVLIAPANPASLVATYSDIPQAGGPIAHTWHVQVAHDAMFRDTVVDAKVPLNITRLQADRLPIGRYFVRVSAIDDDFFEGAWGSVVTSYIMAATSSPVEMHKRTVTLALPTGAGGNPSCAMDGAAIPLPATSSSASIAMTTERAHRLACNLTSDVHAAGEMVFPAVTVGLHLANPALEGDPAAPTGVAFDIGIAQTTPPSAPPGLERLRVITSAGVALGPLSATAVPGHFHATFTAPPPREFQLRVVVDGVETSNNLDVRSTYYGKR